MTYSDNDRNEYLRSSADNIEFLFNDPDEMREAAMSYARAGFACVPNHFMVEGPLGPECSCLEWERKRGNLAPLPCTQPAKHPRVKWKFDDDGNLKKDWDEGQCRRNWDDKHKGANIGLKTGAAHGLFVVDYDGEDGKRAWEEYKAANGLADIVTPEDVSGSGKGGHVFFFYDGPEIPNSASLLAPHVDTRGESGMIYVSPSNHKSGGRYRWVEGRALGDIPLELLPQVIIDELAKKRPGNTATKNIASVKASKSDADPFSRAAGKMGGGWVLKDGEELLGVEAYLALIGDHDGGNGFDNPSYRVACSYFAREGVHAPADGIKERLRATILAAECTDGRNVNRYATDAYLDQRIKDGRDFVLGVEVAKAEAEAAQAKAVTDSVASLNAALDSFDDMTPKQKFDDVEATIARLSPLMPPKARNGLIAKLVNKTGDTKTKVINRLDKLGTAFAKAADEEAKAAERVKINEETTTGGDLSKLPALLIGVDHFSYMLSTAWKRLQVLNAETFRYAEFGGVKTRLDPPDETGRIKSTPMGANVIKTELSKACDWRRGDVGVSAPHDVASHIECDGLMRFPGLSKIVYAPFFAPDGSLVAERGYHAGAKVFYETPPGFVLPAIPVQPTEDDVRAARDLIEGHMLRDFPFSDDEAEADRDNPKGHASRAHAIAALVTQFMRPMIGGFVPIFFVQKPEAGTGASLMVQSLMRVALGRVVEGTVQPQNDEEARKALTGFLMSGEPILFVDNVNQHFHGASFAHFVTCGAWMDRVLGTNQTYSAPVTATTVIAGNRVAMSGEIARRCVPIYLDARIDPKKRSDGDFLVNLDTWVPENRSELVAACLILVRNWISRGKPQWRGKVLPSFGEWSRTLGGVLEAAGIPGFLTNLHIAEDAAAGDSDPWGELCAVWFDRWGSEPRPVGEWNGQMSLVWLIENEGLAIPIRGETEQLKAASLGAKMKHHAQVHTAPDGREFRLSGSGRLSRNKQMWRVELVTGDALYADAAKGLAGSLPLLDAIDIDLQGVTDQAAIERYFGR